MPAIILTLAGLWLLWQWISEQFYISKEREKASAKFYARNSKRK